MSKAVGPCLPLHVRRKLETVELLFQIGPECAICHTDGLAVATPGLLKDYVDKLIESTTNGDVSLIFPQKPAWTLKREDGSNLNVKTWDATAHDRQVLKIVIQSRLNPLENSNTFTVKLGMAQTSQEIKLPAPDIVQLCSPQLVYVRVIACQIVMRIGKKKKRLVQKVSTREHRLFARADVVVGAILDSTSSSVWTTEKCLKDPGYDDLLGLDWKTEREQSLSSLCLDGELRVMLCGGYVADIIDGGAFLGWGA